MGGAERSARKRRQAQAQASTRTPGAKAPTAKPAPRVDRKKLAVTVVAVVVVAGAVLAAVIYTNNKKNATEGKNIYDEARAAGTPSTELSLAGVGDYPAVRQDAVVQVGAEDAKITIDVYEDFLCPACRAFEAKYGKAIDEHLRAGTITVKYHMLPMLNERSDPAGYSLNAANAGLCAADGGRFTKYHLSLFLAQPEESARGWDDAQLTELGTDLGITDPSFASCVAKNRYDSIITAGFDRARDSARLQTETPDGKGFVTPTIVVDGKIVDVDKKGWLDRVLDR